MKEFKKGCSTLEGMNNFLAQHRFSRRNSYSGVHHLDPTSSISSGGVRTKEKKRIETRPIYR